MEGEQIPKATMNNFLKNKLKVSFSAQFANKFLSLAKDYINRLTQQSNDVCTKNDKKTINAQHVQLALQNFGLDNQLKQLQNINTQLKQQNHMKQQVRQRIQENIQKNLQQISGQENQPRLIQMKSDLNIINVDHDNQSEQFDYQAQMEIQQKDKLKELKQKESEKEKEQLTKLKEANQ